jgi:hypothetical protein
MVTVSVFSRSIPLVAAFAILVSSAALGAERVNWLTGTPLRKKLEQSESIAWSGQPLREALSGFSQAHRVAVLIDRRVDPGQPMEVSLVDKPLADCLATVAESRGLGLSLCESVVYLGPPATAHRLRTIIELRKQELRERMGPQKLAWLQGKPWRWDDFATPRGLLADLAKEGRFEILGLESVPHDLWAGADLPPLGFVERLSLVLAQFDYTWRWGPGEREIQIEPMPAEVWLERSYPGGSKAEELAQKLAKALPGAATRISEGKVVVRATVEQHEQIDSGVIRTPKASATNEESLERRTFTLTATNQSVKSILDTLKENVGLELRVDATRLRQSGRTLDKLVSVKVKEATLDETLKAVLTPAGLSFRRTGKSVEIEPAE